MVFRAFLLLPRKTTLLPKKARITIATKVHELSQLGPIPDKIEEEE